MTISAANSIEVPRLLWAQLVGSLRKRGQGRRESGAFLLGKSTGATRHVEALVYYDDLDPKCLESGFIEFHASGYSALWDLCAKRGLSVMADIHTHPGSDVRQSRIDRAHPMIPIPGHVALIAPQFGATSRLSLGGVGLYVFEGSGRWTTFTAGPVNAPLRLSLW